MSEYPSYLIHYGIEGQKWGVRRYQNEDGTYTQEGLERRKILDNAPSKEGYRKLKKEYKSNVKGASKEFNEIRKESGRDKLIQNREKQLEAIDKVDNFARQKAVELFNEYKDLKLYKARLKGKEFDTSKVGMQRYFYNCGIDIDAIYGMSTTASMFYSVRQTKNGVKVTKQLYI